MTPLELLKIRAYDEDEVYDALCHRIPPSLYIHCYLLHDDKSEEGRKCATRPIVLSSRRHGYRPMRQ